jgi:hypothetical protein
MIGGWVVWPLRMNFSVERWCLRIVKYLLFSIWGGVLAEALRAETLRAERGSRGGVEGKRR